MHLCNVDPRVGEVLDEVTSVGFIPDCADQRDLGAEAGGGDRLIGALAARLPSQHAVRDRFTPGGCSCHVPGQVDLMAPATESRGASVM